MPSMMCLESREVKQQQVEREVTEVLKAADLFQSEGLLKHCLVAFQRGLTVHTAIE